MNFFVILGSVLSFLAAAASMEFVARWMHRYVMHGCGWCLHNDHHTTTGRRFQRNDLYALFFAVTSFSLIYGGLRFGVFPLASAGFGVALYGVGYVLFHDIMFHKRVKWIKVRPFHPYLQRIVNAHRIHHSTVTKDGARSFSFLWAPRRYDPRYNPKYGEQLREIRRLQAKQ